MIEPCPSDDVLALHVDGQLRSTERAEIAKHLDGCGECRRLVGDLAAARTRTHSTRDSEVFPASTWRWASGCRVGRYELQGPLGRGGMGEVYEALDLELRRLVAIKVARPGSEDHARSDRIVSEGQTLASLDHPNVVRVFDAGTHDGAAYIVIERAQGSSLRRWLAASPRHVRDVLRLFRGVAMGCAAIHEAGLVHRDIKPDNILISDDDEGLLSDFGLASATRRGPSGTPGYIAPEVERGDEATPASDQFALCVTLAEALGSCTRGRVPRWTHDVIARGTHEDPLQRFESMEALLARLKVPRSTIRMVGVATAVVAAAATVVALVAPADPADACRWKDGAWPHAELDDQTWRSFQQDWTDAAQRACDQHVDVATRTCLQQQRRDATVLLDAMQGAQSSANPLTGLDPQSCFETSSAVHADAVTHTRATIARAEAARLEGRMQDARALATEAAAQALATGDPRVLAAALQESGLVALDLGEFEVAAETFESAYWMALRVERPAIAADSASELVDLLSGGHHFEQARQWRLHASAALQRLSEAQPVRWAQLELVTSLMHQRMQAYPQSVTAARAARDHAQRLEPPPQWLLIAVEARVGGALDAAGDAEGAREHLERALQWQLELRGEQHPSTAKILFMLGTLSIVSLYETDEGVAFMKRVVAILDQPGSPPSLAAAKAYETLAHTYMSAEQYEDARAAVSRTVALYGALYPAEHPRQLGTYTLRANLAQADGEHDEAWRWAEDGLLLANRTLGGSAVMTGSMSATAGELALRQEKFDIAEQRFETALAIFEETTGPDHPLNFEALTSLGNAKAGGGEVDEAIACYERALEIAPSEAAKARPLLGLARASTDPADVRRYAELARAADPLWASAVEDLLNRTPR